MRSLDRREVAMESNRVVVAECMLPDVPDDEGSFEIMVGREQKAEWLSIPIDGPYWLFHKPYCGGPMRPHKITDQNMVLCCGGCNLRLPVRFRNLTKMPTNLGELAEAIEDTRQRATHYPPRP